MGENHSDKDKQEREEKNEKKKRKVIFFSYSLKKFQFLFSQYKENKWKKKVKQRYFTNINYVEEKKGENNEEMKQNQIDWQRDLIEF